jgi:hypothetical protein
MKNHGHHRSVLAHSILKVINSCVTYHCGQLANGADKLKTDMRNVPVGGRAPADIQRFECIIYYMRRATTNACVCILARRI